MAQEKELHFSSFLVSHDRCTSTRILSQTLTVGQQVVEEMLDAQRPGCIPEYEDMLVPKCHPLYDPDCRADRYIPFLRNRYDFGTGYSPNVPRMQLNEITPWLDGGLMYGVTKAWADALRSFEGGELLALNGDPLDLSLPADNTLGLPLANPPPPANHSLFEVNRFWSEYTLVVPEHFDNLFFIYRDWKSSWE